MIIVKVKGHVSGLGWNTYPFDFTFTMNGKREDWESDEIRARAFREAKKKSGSDEVRITMLAIEEVL